MARPRGSLIGLLLFWFFIAFEVRLVVLLALHLYSLGAGYEGFYPLASGHDDRFYYAAAVSLLEGDEVALPNFYPLLLAGIFYLFGPSLLLGKLVNPFLGALGVVFAVLLAERLYPWRGYAWSWRRPSHVVGALLSLYPSAVFYSTQLVKDAAIWALGLALLYWGVAFLQRPSLGSLLPIVAASWLLWLFRPYTAIAFWMALALPGVMFRNPRLLLGFVAAAVAVPWAMGFGPLGLSYLGPILAPEEVSEFREQAYGIGGSSLGLNLDPERPLAFALAWMYSFVTVLLGPFPWQVDSLLEAAAMAEALPMWLLAAFWFSGVVRLSRPGLAEVLLLFGLILAGGIGLFSDNIGANTRLRLLVWASLVIYAALRMGVRRADPLLYHPR